jgi:hypothetical protein
MFVRPPTSTVDAKLTSLPGNCSGCGAEDLAAYRVLSEGGWWDVIKCRQCLISLERRPGPLLGALSEAIDSLVPTAAGRPPAP